MTIQKGLTGINITMRQDQNIQKYITIIETFLTLSELGRANNRASLSYIFLIFVKSLKKGTIAENGDIG